jgi:hypothetical protein
MVKQIEMMRAASLKKILLSLPEDTAALPQWSSEATISAGSN